MSLKSFTTSAENVPEEERATAGKPITVKIDNRKVTFLPWDTNQFVLITAIIESGMRDTQLVAQLINVFFGMIEDENDKRFLKSQLWDPKSGFTIATIAEILTYLLEEWSANPTGPSSGSSSSRASTGKTSKGRRSGRAHHHRGASPSPSGAASSSAGSPGA